MSSDVKTVWPTKRQELLLQAALARSGDSISAWQKCRSKIAWDEPLDVGSIRLLPLVYQNMHRHGLKDPLLNKLKGTYRLAWYQNQVKFRLASDILRLFHKAGIESMVLKGTALALLHYKDKGVRPMNDIDVLVRPKEVHLAIELLRKAGWMPTERPREELFRYGHALQFKNQSAAELDLHWHLLAECCQEGADEDFWEKPVSVKLGDVSTFALNPTDTLLHTIIHGVRWNPLPSIRWVADSITIINSSEIDWVRLSDQAQTRRLGLRLKEGLSYLRKQFQPCLNKSVAENVGSIRTTLVERIEWRYAATSQERSLLGSLPSILVKYLRLTKDTKLYRAIFGLPEYLQYRFRVRDKKGLIFLLMRKCVKRTMQTISSRTADGKAA